MSNITGTLRIYGRGKKEPNKLFFTTHIVTHKTLFQIGKLANVLNIYRSKNNNWSFGVYGISPYKNYQAFLSESEIDKLKAYIPSCGGTIQKIEKIEVDIAGKFLTFFK